MRQITFGPTETNYFDMDEEERSPNAHAHNDSTEINSERVNARLQRTGTLSGASSPRQTRQRGSNFSSAFNVSQGRLSDNKNTEDV